MLLLSIHQCNYHYRPVLKNYQYILALSFAIYELNKDPVVLPNVTLGLRIYEDNYHAGKTYKHTLSLLSTRKQIVPNYKCDKQDKLLSVVGGLDSKISRQMASILDIFKIPQVGLWSFIAQDMSVTETWTSMALFSPPIFKQMFPFVPRFSQMNSKHWNIF